MGRMLVLDWLGCGGEQKAVTGLGATRAGLLALFWKSKRRFRRSIGYPHWGMLDGADSVLLLTCLPCHRTPRAAHVFRVVGQG
jgi:hypothetical protein